MNYSSDQLRQWYREAINSEVAANQFWKHLQGYRGTHALTLAYKAAAMSFLAKHAWNPFRKLENLEKANLLFIQAVHQEPKHVEIRFLRFAVQHYIPSFLGFSKHLGEDIKIILEGLKTYRAFNLSNIEARSIFAFMHESGRCTELELEELKKYMLANNDPISD